jgi:hypothetical protein
MVYGQHVQLNHTPHDFHLRGYVKDKFYTMNQHIERREKGKYIKRTHGSFSGRISSGRVQPAYMVQSVCVSVYRDSTFSTSCNIGQFTLLLLWEDTCHVSENLLSLGSVALYFFLPHASLSVPSHPSDLTGWHCFPVGALMEASV